MTAIGLLAPSAGASPNGRGELGDPASCRFSPAEGTLSLAAGEQLTRLRRSAGEILFIDGRRRVPCTGGSPTITNVDLIRVESRGEFRIDLRSGLFAPGLTDEGDGSSEIEIRAVFRDTGGVRVRGASGRDRIRMGTLAGRRAINLDSTEASPDADVVVSGGSNVTSVLARAGRDRISASGGRGFDGPLETPVRISAGTGNDRVVGTARRDLIGGGRGNDVVLPLDGRDRVRTSAGDDTIIARDGLRDVIRCGRGRDRLTSDSFDLLIKGCEPAPGLRPRP